MIKNVLLENEHIYVMYIHTFKHVNVATYSVSIRLKSQNTQSVDTRVLVIYSNYKYKMYINYCDNTHAPTWSFTAY